MSVRSNSIVTLDTRIQGGEIAHSTANLKCFCNAVTIQSFFKNSFTMMCMALYTYSCIATRIRNLVAGL